MDDMDMGGVADAAEAETLEPWRGLVPHGRLPDMLAQRIGVDILKGVHPQGEVLPNEIDFSATLDISRSAFRETMRILAAKGMVESRPKTGTRVTDRKRWNVLDPEVLRWMFEAGPNEAFILDLFELRLITEPALAALAARRRSDVHVRAMEAALIVMAAETLDTERGRQADLEFHAALIEAAGNEALASLSSSIEAAIAWSTRYKISTGAFDRDSVPDHRAVCEAVARGDEANARWYMETLVRLALRDTLSSMEALRARSG